MWQRRSARFSGSRSNDDSSRRGQATSATPGPTSRPRARRSATSRASISPQGSSSRPKRSLPASRPPVKILRVIARLNMGGPALHVAYLTAGLRERGYETTLAAGTLGQGEQSMAYVEEELGVLVTSIPHLHREISHWSDHLTHFMRWRSIPHH